MIYGIYAIRDAKTAFMPATVDFNNDAAIRNFEHACKVADSLMASHPADYSLWCLGSYNTDTGVISAEDVPVQIADASSILRK